VEIVKLFQPRERGKGAPGTGGGSAGGLSTVDKRRLLEKARQAGIKLPKKGI